MDALSDPKGYLSAQEKEQAKRAEALAKIGIDETEIDTTNVILGKGNILKLMNRKQDCKKNMFYFLNVDNSK